MEHRLKPSGKMAHEASVISGTLLPSRELARRSSRVTRLADALGTAPLELFANYSFAQLSRLWLSRCT